MGKIESHQLGVVAAACRPSRKEETSEGGGKRAGLTKAMESGPHNLYTKAHENGGFLDLGSWRFEGQSLTKLNLLSNKCEYDIFRHFR